MNKKKLLESVIASLEAEKKRLRGNAEELRLQKNTAPTAMESNSDRNRFELETAEGRVIEIIAEYDATLSCLRGFSLPEEKNDEIVIGSVIEAADEKGNLKSYFLLPESKNVPVEFEKRNYLLINPATPIGRAFLGKKTGEKISFNNRTLEITAVK